MLKTLKTSKYKKVNKRFNDLGSIPKGILLLFCITLNRVIGLAYKGYSLKYIHPFSSSISTVILKRFAKSVAVIPTIYTPLTGDVHSPHIT